MTDTTRRLGYTVGFKHGGVVYYGNDFEAACRLCIELRANVFSGAPIKPELVVDRFPWGVRTAEALLTLSLDYPIRDIDEIGLPTSEILAVAQAAIDGQSNRDHERNEAILRVQAAQRATLQGFRIGDAVRVVKGPAASPHPMYIVSAGKLNRSIGVAPRDDRKATMVVIAEELELFPPDEAGGDWWIGGNADAVIGRTPAGEELTVDTLVATRGNPLQLTEDERAINELAGELKELRGDLRRAQWERDRARDELAKELARSLKSEARLDKLETILLSVLRGDGVPDIDLEA